MFQARARQSLTLSFLLVAMLLSVAAVGASAAPAGVNLLVNPGFESPYAKQCCHTEPNFPADLPIDEVQVADGWRGWWRDNDAAHPLQCDSPGCVIWHRPEWREAAPYQNRIRSGSNAQKYFTFWSVHEAGMLQTVGGIAPGQRLQFSVFMHAWSNNSNEVVSAGQQSMHMKVGIDPTGGTNPWAASVVWGAEQDSYDQFGQYTVEAVARSSSVTVFTYSQPVYPLQHNDVYVDDASLVVVDARPASATPSRATATRSPGAAWVTPTPNAAGQIVYTVRRGEYLSLIAVKFGVKLDTLKKLNNLTYPYRLAVGQRLIIAVVKK